MRVTGSQGRPKADYAPSSVDHLTDAQLMTVLSEGRRRYHPGAIALTDHVFRVNETIVAKYCRDYGALPSDALPSEALTLDLVFHHTRIPVPRVRRVVHPDKTPAAWVFMDRIPGKQLSAVWPTMSVAERLRVVFTLRDYVRQLQAIRHPRAAVPGPVAPGTDVRHCISPVFGQVIDVRGPFASYDKLSSWFDQAQRLVTRNTQQALQSPLHHISFKTLMGTSPLVLCHQDLHMRNIIVGDDGRLWLIDWEFAGFYPPWFEYLAMKEQSRNEERVMNREEPFWDLMIPFICGPHYREEAWMRCSINIALDYRFEEQR